MSTSFPAGRTGPRPDHGLEIRNVSKAFRLNGAPLDVLDGIDLDLRPGEFVTIVGASGCGKSTLLRMIAGLDSDYGGEILHAGKPVQEPSLDRGIVFQEPRLFPWLTVARNVAMGLENSKLSKAEKARSIADHLALVGLTDFADAYPSQLSGGMAQRTAIARGLINRPDLLLLDEPFGALDALTRARLQRELQAIWSKERITMLLVTHDVDEAVFLGDRVVVMSPRPGRIARIFDVPHARPRKRTDDELVRLRNDVLTALEAATGDNPAEIVDFPGVEREEAARIHPPRSIKAVS